MTESVYNGEVNWLRNLWRDFPSLCRGHRFQPWLGNSAPSCHTVWPPKMKKNQWRLSWGNKHLCWGLKQSRKWVKRRKSIQGVWWPSRRGLWGRTVWLIPRWWAEKDRPKMICRTLKLNNLAFKFFLKTNYYLKTKINQPTVFKQLIDKIRFPFQKGQFDCCRC